MYYYGARWYDAALGRFIQADTIIPNGYNSQAFDRYAYVLNNPLRFTDPSGYKPCDGYDAGMPGGCSPDTDKDPNAPDDNGKCHTDACRKAAAEDTYQKKYKYYQGCLNNPGSGCPDAKEIATFIGFSLVLASIDILGPAVFAELQGLWGALVKAACADGVCTNEVRDIANQVTGIIYRSGPNTVSNLTPRPGKDVYPGGGLSFWTSLENITGKYIGIDASKLQNLIAKLDNKPPGHVSVTPFTFEELQAWAATRGTEIVSPFTQELLNLLFTGKK